jgi:hypothetical protein
MENSKSPQVPSSFASPLPRYLYKYREINSFTQDIMTKGEFYFSSPNTFNDPFDCGASLIIPTDPEGLDQLHGYLAKFSDNETATGIITTLADPRVEMRCQQDLLSKVIDKQTRDIGLCCFSECKNSILMWSHYAACHRGICVEVDTEKLTHEHRGMFANVAYSIKYPTVAMPLNQADMLSIVYTKARQWEYEHEWRARCRRSGIVKLGSEAITGVILGCTISGSDEAAVREWIATRHNPIKIARCVKSDVTYRLEFHPDK